MPRESKAAKSQRALRINRILTRLYPAQTALNHSNPFELLIATILSAQCTDVRVNLVLPKLFARFRTPEEFAAADPGELEELIRSTGFFRSKARSIQAASRAILTDFGGAMPDTIEALTRLRGVGRKTANVVLGSAFGIASGVVVDTHVGRLSRRMQLSRHTDPTKVEKDLMTLLPQTEWIGFSHRMIWHGRSVCTARRPLCADCRIAHDCPSAAKYLSAYAKTIGRPSKRPAGRAAGLPRRRPAS